MIEIIINKETYDSFIICGDWNRNTARQTAQGRLFRDFLIINAAKLCWKHEGAIINDTYVNHALGHYSCIDHIVMSLNVFTEVKLCDIIRCSTNPSSHYLVSIHVDEVTSRNESNRFRCNEEGPLWDKVTQIEVSNYQNVLDQMLNTIVHENDIISCQNVNCVDNSHRLYIDYLCECITWACIDAGIMTLPLKKHGICKQIPLWNEVVGNAKSRSMWWHQIWIDKNRPTEGVVYEIMKAMRANYHECIMQLKRNDNVNRKVRFAESVTQNNNRSFWKEVKKMDFAKKCVPVVVDNCIGDVDICNMFAKKYEELYNSNRSEHEAMSRIKMSLQNRLMVESSEGHIDVSVSDVEKAIMKLKSRKSDGSEGLESDHTIQGTDTLNSIITVLICLIMAMCQY